MPSDPRTAAALEGLRPARETFESTVAATLEELRVYLDTHRSEADDRLAVLAAELGPVGARHIDVTRLATVLASDPGVPAQAQTVLTRALETLGAVAEGGDDAYVLDVPPGASLYGLVTDRLAVLGRAMGAARVAEAARHGRYRPAEHDRWLDGFAFGRWSQAERAVAPPLVIEVDGADLRAGGLAEFLDGAVKIVLVVRGEASPVPLVRLVTPRTFVAQAGDDGVVKRMLAWDGPAIAAFMPDGTARFVHDPSAGGALAARLVVADLPSVNHQRRAGPFTVAQQREELEQLKALQATAAAAPAPAAVAVPAEPDDPAGKLAAWLLQQADLSGA